MSLFPEFLFTQKNKPKLALVYKIIKKLSSFWLFYEEGSFSTPQL